MYTAQDIEVFVLTHKRPQLLKETLDGYLQQTVKGFRLAVFSNGHSPETKQLLQEYAARGVEDFYVDEELKSNLSRALRAITRKIVIVAHDDDFIHPQYVEAVLALYNKFPNLALVLSGQAEGPNVWHKSTILQQAYHFKNKHEFAAYIYSGGGFTYSSASYKASAVQGKDPLAFVSYGKVSDVPFMTSVCGEGEAAITCFPYIKTRIHAEQDSLAFTTGPTAEEWIALALFYKCLLDNPQYPSLRWLFKLQNYRHIRIGWRDWCKCEYNKMNFYQFCHKALQAGALTLSAIGIGLVLRGQCNHYIQKKLAKFSIVDW